MKRLYISVLLGALLVIAASIGINRIVNADKKDLVKVGIIFVGDVGTAYTANFVQGMNAIEHTYGDKVEIIPKYNVPEGSERVVFEELVEAECDIIFSTSYGYGEIAKQIAVSNPDIEICQMTCSNANEEPVLPNYHNAMGEIYEGRYVTGVVAGMKLKKLIDSGKISVSQAKIGYVAAFPYAEVISGYTSFFLGVRSVVPEATMIVDYTNTWSNFTLEKASAEKLIEQGCVIISQHSDTTGVAVACENTDKSVEVYSVSYNRSMADVAPTTYLTGCRIDWEPYMVSAVGAVIDGKKIESRVSGNIHGNDASAGFDKGWVSMLALNERVAAEGTSAKIEELIEGFKKDEIMVFKGDYTGVDPFDENDVYDLSQGYKENASASAPSFHYVLKDVITVIE